MSTQRRRTAHEVTEVMFGLRAGFAVLTRRLEDVHSVHVAEEHRSELRRLLPKNFRAPVRVDGADALGRLAKTPHHEGLVLVVAPRPFAPVADFSAELRRRKGLAVVLDRVRNPYNIGAIVRTAAFFGVDSILLGMPAPHPALPPDAVRVAEGGAESIRFSRTTDLGASLARLREEGVSVLGIESDGKEDLAEARVRGPSVLVFGHEREGLSDRVRRSCTHTLRLVGSGQVGSLNVSVTAGIAIAFASRWP